MITLRQLEALYWIVQLGTFERAAARLNTTQSAISKRIQELEAALGIKLLNRDTHSLSVTAAGADYAESCRSLLSQHAALDDQMQSRRSDPSGLVRILVTKTFGEAILAPVIAEFTAMYPKVEFDVTLEDRAADLAGEGYDLGVRTGDHTDSTMIARTIGRSKRTVVASPDYLAHHDRIERPADLASHRILHYSSRRMGEIWRYAGPDGGDAIRVRPYQVSNSASQLMQWVKAGLGVTLLPAYITGEMLQSGEAVQVLPDIDWGMTQISALMPQGRGTPRRVRTLVDFLVLKFDGQIA